MITKMSRGFRFGVLQIALFAFCFAIPFSALARLDDADQLAMECEYEDFLADLMGSESGNDPTIQNEHGYSGLYQIGEQAMYQSGVYYEPQGNLTGSNMDWAGNWVGNVTINGQQHRLSSMSDFLNNPTVQRYVVEQVHADYVSQMSSSVLNSGYSMSSLVSGCHLIGCGALNSCLKGISNGTAHKKSDICTDFNGTSALDYMDKFADYTTPWGQDGGTCDPTGEKPHTDPSQTYFNNPMCDPRLKGQIIDLARGRSERKIQDFKDSFTPPADLDQIAGGPCFSKELNKITSQFANIGGSLNINLGGDAGAIMNNFFKAGYESLNNATQLMPQMLNFQTQASQALGGLLSQLGGGALGSAFDSELCGMMTDMLVKFVQCQFPMEIPEFDLNVDLDLGSLFPEGCAGEAAKEALFGAADAATNKQMGQTISRGSNGTLTISTPTD